MLSAIRRYYYLLGLKALLRKKALITDKGPKLSSNSGNYLVSLPHYLGGGFVTKVVPGCKQLEIHLPFPESEWGKPDRLCIYRVETTLAILKKLTVKGPCHNHFDLIISEENNLGNIIFLHLKGHYVLRKWRDRRKGKHFDKTFTAVDESFKVLSALAEADAFYNDVAGNVLLQKLYGVNVIHSEKMNQLSLRLYKLLKGLKSKNFVEVPDSRPIAYTAKITPEGLFKLESMRQERLAEKHRQKHDRKTVSIARWAMIAAMCSAIGTGIQACSTSTKADIKKPERVIIPLPITKETTHNQH